MKSNRKHEQGSHHIIIAVAGAAVLIGAIGFMFWNNVIDKDSSQNSSATNKTVNTNHESQHNTKNTKNTNATSPITDTVKDTAPRYLMINEWGKKMLLTPSLYDLKYSNYFAYTSNGVENKASTITLTLNGCPLGSIGREDEAVFKQTQNAGGIFEGEVVAKLDNHYYRYAGAGGVSGVPACATNELQNLVRAAVATVQNK